MTGPALRGIAIDDAGGVNGGRENIGRDGGEDGVGGSPAAVTGAVTGFAAGGAWPALSAVSARCSGSDTDAAVAEEVADS